MGSLGNPEDIQPVVQFQKVARTFVPHYLVGRYQWVLNAEFGVLRNFSTCPVGIDLTHYLVGELDSSPEFLYNTYLIQHTIIAIHTIIDVCVRNVLKHSVRDKGKFIQDKIKPNMIDHPHKSPYCKLSV
ncbi:hypothetical protein AVEN_67832-1 [Araneus ventricosus]|uniref:Uncharacterized protein n=1 Tax=Araneus ventricosus TaxID=182803 RepID=A0A4Y2ME52_ARAVE|nr:hypothetical protein AVEN_67832-1 [Araneus ventricosus]